MKPLRIGMFGGGTVGGGVYGECRGNRTVVAVPQLDSISIIMSFLSTNRTPHVVFVTTSRPDCHFPHLRS